MIRSWETGEKRNKCTGTDKTGSSHPEYSRVYFTKQSDFVPLKACAWINLLTLCVLVEWFIVVYSCEITHEKLSWEGNFFSITLTWLMCVSISGCKSYYEAVIDLSICKTPGFDVFRVYFHKDSSIPHSCIVGKNFCVIYRQLMSHSFRWALSPTVSMYHDIFMKGL